MKNSISSKITTNRQLVVNIKKAFSYLMRELPIPLPLFVVFMFLIQTAFAQTTQLDEVVYLKNGSIIRGIIIEQVPNKTIKIKTADENLFVFKMDEIEKITKEPSKIKPLQMDNSCLQKQEPKANDKEKKPTQHIITGNSEKEKYKGNYKFLLEGSYVFGAGKINTDEEIYDPFTYQSEPLELNNDDGGFSLRTIHGYKASEIFVIGAGIGVDVFKNMTLLPIFLDTRLDLSKGATRPYINLAIGTSIPLNAIEGGTNFNAGFGVKTKMTGHFQLITDCRKPQ